jgi:hypothetical protein
MLEAVIGGWQPDADRMVAIRARPRTRECSRFDLAAARPESARETLAKRLTRRPVELDKNYLGGRFELTFRFWRSRINFPVFP